MTNSNRNSTWGLSILFSFSTAFLIVIVTAKLFDYYVGERFKHGLDAGAGVVFLFLFGLTIMFVIALLVWRVVSGKPRNLNSSFVRWIVSLAIGLGAGYLIILMITNNWKTESYADFVHNQELIVFGFPFFSMIIYTFSLSVLHRT